ncbi:hypothetical protein IDM40_08995 [Nocardiopsis sp. HNM0947]|uniref:Uncharacterized protein n=1 Tax=Nocardiopsis coralli TaxID=2772213 RepID=A0ABR9P4S1_9ACTN|nr:hypothetical protein [Nocardiopsis coralli]MBE2998839.1 hypothetical protein [Nocardiopsis coralli]
MIIWTGWGILVPGFILLGAAGLGLAAEGTFGGDAGFFGAATGILLSAVLIFLVGRKLNKPEQGFHPKTGEPVVYRNRHTFFFIPMQYWAAVAAVLGPVMGVAAAVNV